MKKGRVTDVKLEEIGGFELGDVGCGFRIGLWMLSLTLLGDGLRLRDVELKLFEG